MSHDDFGLGLHDINNAGVYAIDSSDISALSAAMRDADLKVIRIDLDGVSDKRTLLARLAAQLDFPAGFGGNWDALADNLRDLQWLPANGYALFLADVDALRAGAGKEFDTLLDILDEASRDWVGRDAGKIAAAIGLNVPEQTRLLFFETSATHPFAVTELMMPVLPVVRVANVDEAIELAVKLEGGCHHTAAMHSRNIDNMNRMANAIDTSIFVKNGPCIAGLGLGGEGWTTMTITTPTGEGVTSARTFVRLRRCVLVDAFRIV